MAWLQDILMVVAPLKTKLIIGCTPEMREARCSNVDFSIDVCGKTIKLTESEKLLGIIINQDLTWSHHLWGETWRDHDNHPGLINQLLKRLGMLKYLARTTSRNKMRSLVPGLFLSKLRYGIALTSSVWGLVKYGEQENQHQSITKLDMYRLQTAHTQAARLLCPSENKNQYTPTKDILNEAGWLSVHQLVAQVILTLVIRILNTRKPKYLADRLELLPDTRTRIRNLRVPRARLNITFETFLSQATRLYNLIIIEIQDEENKTRQKKMLEKWITNNIPVKP